MAITRDTSCNHLFCRLAQAPPTQPDVMYINSSKIPEAAKALDPGLDVATVAAWMVANGFQEVTTNGFEEATNVTN